MILESHIKMIEDLSSAFGPSGFEDDVIEVVKKYVKDLGKFEEDSLRNLYLYRKENTGKKPILMLDAHSDEVGLIVKSINSNGTLRFLTLGSWNKFSLSSMRVLIKNSKGDYIPGIVAVRPIHYMSKEERNHQQFNISDLYIDIGASSKEEVIQGYKIRIGDPIVPDTSFCVNEKKNQLIGKAFDCRIGCAALIASMQQMKGKNYPFDIVCVFSSQEEVGDRGCKVAVNHVKPAIAICFEGAPADDMIFNKDDAQTVINKGTMLRVMDHSMISNPRFMRFAFAIAEKEMIPYQIAVRESGGNNGSVINTALEGVPVIVAGIPVRYAHSPNGIVSLDDFENTVNLAVSIIENLSRSDLNSF